jgi:glycine cleavage system H protein
VNTAPFGDGWMIKLRLKDGKEKDALLNADAYSAHLGH